VRKTVNLGRILIGLRGTAGEESGMKWKWKNYSPSRALSKPDRLKVEPSSLVVDEVELLVVEEVVELGAPVELASLETPLVKAASKSE
jgi:hypothetical protein